MAQPFPIQRSFPGMRQDEPRDRIGTQFDAGALWNCVDWIPVILGAPLRKRGGWSYASTALGSCTYVQGLAYAPFAAGAKNIAIGSDGHVYDFTSGSNSDIGTAFAVGQNPVYHRTGTAGLVVIPAASGTTTPKSWDRTTFQDLAGTPPQGIYGAVWNDHLLLANGTAGGTLYQRRLWFSPAGDAAAAWDLADSWEDFALPITGLAVLKTAILVFHIRSTERLKGTTPPSVTTTGDLQRDDAFDVGCVDARSIVKYNDTVVWADTRGVYQSDGAALKNLTATGGMSSYWKTVLSAYTASYTVAAGIFNDTYIVSINNGTTFVDCLAYDLQRGFWYRLGNFGFRCFARVGSTFEETYAGMANGARVGYLSTILAPAAGVKNDADGTAVAPYYETSLFRGFLKLHRRWIPSLSLQSWNQLYATYDLRDVGDAPTITVSYATDPGATSYTAISRTLAATSKLTRLRRNLFFQGAGLILKVAQTGASSDTLMYGLEADYSPLEESRMVQ